VGLPQDIDARRYYRVAIQRLEEADLILTKLSLAHAAIYLSGYAVECILKALVVVRTPLRERPAILKALKEDRRFGRNLAGLRDGAVARGAIPPREIGGHLVYVSTWSEQMRYDPAERDLADAERFVRAARAIFRWADGSI
jgi:HEPN domain-containing protein